MLQHVDSVDTEQLEQLKDQLREEICALLRKPPYVRALDSVEISEALVASALAWRDYNDGLDGTCHAAKRVHELIDIEAAKLNPEYTPEKLDDYLRRTKQKR